jgi:hypothetical protein
LQVGEVVEGVDREERDVRDVHDLERIVLVVQDHRRVVSLLAGRREVRVLERSPDELLKPKKLCLKVLGKYEKVTFVLTMPPLNSDPQSTTTYLNPTQLKFLIVVQNTTSSGESCLSDLFFYAQGWLLYTVMVD